MSAEPGTSAPPAKGPPSLLHRIDDGLYAIERFAVVTTMLAMVLMVFFDVLNRRLAAPESKMAGFLFALVKPFGVARDAAWLERAAPWVGGVIVLAIIRFGFATVRRRHGSGLAPVAEWIFAAIGTALLGGLAWMMTHRPACELYALVGLLAAAAVAASAWRTKKVGWQRTAAIAAVAGLGGAALLRAIIPEDYSWAKEVAMILLVWTGFIGASMCAHQGRHIDIDFGKKLFPARLRVPAGVAAHLVTVAFSALIVILGAIYVFGASGLYRLGGRFPHTGIPDWTVAFAIPWSFGLIGLRTLIAASRVARGDLTAKGSSPSAVAAVGHGAPPPKPEEG